jgi:hypothetical protein
MMLLVLNCRDVSANVMKDDDLARYVDVPLARCCWELIPRVVDKTTCSGSLLSGQSNTRPQEISGMNSSRNSRKVEGNM